MKVIKNLPNLPREIDVKVKKGSSGVLLAELPKYDIFTEADDLNHLFLQVNDLVYTYFDLPKKYHDQVHFIPPQSVQHQLISIEQEKPKKNEIFKMSTFYTPEFCKRVLNG